MWQKREGITIIPLACGQLRAMYMPLYHLNDLNAPADVTGLHFWQELLVNFTYNPTQVRG